MTIKKLLTIVLIPFGLFLQNANATVTQPPLSITQIHQQYKAGALTAEQLTSQFINRIETLNENYNAIIAIDPSALSQARQLDKLQAQGLWAGPLHGITVLLKDNIHSKGPIATTAGSLALTNNITQIDATVVKKLRAAGAIILGKTNLSEWANFRSSHSSSGWSAVGGQTHNAVDVIRNPCGSSSGSAVAVALNFSTIALGTETDGSITCPASVNGVYAIKPSMGEVSRFGVIPLSSSQDTVGPMAHNLEDALTTLRVMQGKDINDTSTNEYIANTLASKPKKTLRIGALNADKFPISTQQLYQQQLKKLTNAGHKIVPIAFEKNFGNLFADEYFILLYDFKVDINDYLKNTPSTVKVRSLKQLIDFNEQHKEQELQYFGQEILHKAQAIDVNANKTKYLRIKQRYRKQALTLLENAYNNDIDILIAPTTAPAWKTSLINGDNFQGSSSSIPAIAGTTHISLAVGQVNGLPVGLSILAAPKQQQNAYVYAKQINELLKKPE